MPKSSDDSMNKVSIQTGKCYSVLKRNELLGHEKMRRNLKRMLVSERGLNHM